jgi:hydrogenase maturation protease
MRGEGVGVHAVEALRKNFDFPEDVRLLDGGTLGLDLLPFIEGMEGILFVDAVDVKREPGTIAVIQGESPPSWNPSSPCTMWAFPIFSSLPLLWEPGRRKWF